MAGEIQALFNKYQQKYPLFTRNAIVELMLDDGVITFDVANKIKSGVSLFLLDNDWFEPKNNNLSMTEIMGGIFTKTKTKPKTSFNRRIEPTKQSMTQGDCWLLSDINALSYKDWGRKAIHDAILPDEDGSGGVTIKFKGSPLKQKEIHITAYQIGEARKSGNYSDGDDDMIALELATEITFRKMVHLGLAKRLTTDKELQEENINYRSYIYCGVATKDFNQYPISKLLGLPTRNINFFVINNMNSDNYIADKDKILKFISQHDKDISMQCTFAGYTGNKYVHGGHMYAVKKLCYGKKAILRDPYDDTKEINLPWKDFVTLIDNAYYQYNNQNVDSNLIKLLPTYYSKKNEECKKVFNPCYKTN